MARESLAIHPIQLLLLGRKSKSSSVSGAWLICALSALGMDRIYNNHDIYIYNLFFKQPLTAETWGWQMRHELSICASFLGRCHQTITEVLVPNVFFLIVSWASKYVSFYMVSGAMTLGKPEGLQHVGTHKCPTFSSCWAATAPILAPSILWGPSLRSSAFSSLDQLDQLDPRWGWGNDFLGAQWPWDQDTRRVSCGGSRWLSVQLVRFFGICARNPGGVRSLFSQKPMIPR